MRTERPSPVFISGGFGCIEDAAHYLGVSTVKIYRDIRAGRLRAWRAGRLIRLKREDCDAAMHASPVEPYRPHRPRKRAS